MASLRWSLVARGYKLYPLDDRWSLRIWHWQSDLI